MTFFHDANLKFCKIPYVVYLGLLKDSEGKLRAHAWVVSGSSYITGKSAGPPFTIVSVFTNFIERYVGGNLDKR